MDIYYISFNKERADERWAEFWDSNLQEIVDQNHERIELEEKMRSLKREIGERMSTHSYLMTQGITHPSEQEIINATADIDRGVIKWQPDVSDLEKELTIIRKKLDTLPFIPDDFAGSDLFYYLKDGAEEEELLWSLRCLDIIFGGVSVYLEDGKAEYRHIKMLYDIFLPDKQFDYDKVTNEDLISIFENMNSKVLDAAFNDPKFIAKHQIDEDSKEWFVTFLKEIQPVIKDLKDSNGEFFREWNGDYDKAVLPMLDARAKKHLEILFEKYPKLKT